MSAIQRWLDRFCYKHPRFGIPNLMLVIVVGNVLVWLMDQFSYGVSLSALLAFSPYYILHGQIWRIITFVFVPLDSNLFFLAVSLYFYYMIGSVLEREWGTAKFNVFYGLGILLNVVVGFLLYAVTAPLYPSHLLPLLTTASMTYVNLSLFFAFATLYPNMQVLLFFIIPIKIKWLAWIDAALFGWSVLSSLFGVFTSGLAALPGVIIPLVAILNSSSSSAGSNTRPPARPSTSRRPPSRPSSRRAISTSAPSAARPTPTTPTRNFVTAPSATAITATVRSTSTTTFTYNKKAARRTAFRPSAAFL